MSICDKQKEEICLCRDCAVTNCERYNCQECASVTNDKIHEVLFCNVFRKMDCGK